MDLDPQGRNWVPLDWQNQHEARLQGEALKETPSVKCPSIGKDFLLKKITTKIKQTKTKKTIITIQTNKQKRRKL